jgi:hypothetical protein
MTPEEFFEQYIEALEQVGEATGPLQNLSSLLYPANDELDQYIQKLEAICSKQHPTDADKREAGNLMEQIAFLAFRNLARADSLQSYRSPVGQHDLLVSGQDVPWTMLMSMCQGNKNFGGILVEAKAWGGKVGTAEFLRLYALIEISMKYSCDIGVFFTVKGASGFPRDPGTHQTKVSECRLLQVLAMAKSGIRVVVFDLDEIKTLVQAGSLPVALQRKIKDIEAINGRWLPSTSPDVQLVDLPEHLKGL